MKIWLRITFSFVPFTSPPVHDLAPSDSLWGWTWDVAFLKNLLVFSPLMDTVLVGKLKSIAAIFWEGCNVNGILGRWITSSPLLFFLYKTILDVNFNLISQGCGIGKHWNMPLGQLSCFLSHCFCSLLFFFFFLRLFACLFK